MKSFILSLLLLVATEAIAFECQNRSNYQQTPNGYIVECLRVNISKEGIPYAWLAGSYYSIWEPTQHDTLATGFASLVKRKAGSTTSQTVAGQFNAWSMDGVTAYTWGIATEAVAAKGSKSILVGIESLVGNFEPTNIQPKIGLNVVFKNTMNSTGPSYNSSKNNANSWAIWISSDIDTGFESAIKLDRHSISSSSNRARAAVIDLSELDPSTLDQIDLIKLPNGKAIYWNRNTNSLAVR
jgi:hypothetical protein